MWAAISCRLGRGRWVTGKRAKEQCQLGRSHSARGRVAVVFEPESWLAVSQVEDLKRHLVVSVDRLAAASACAGCARRSRGRYYTDRSPCGMGRGGLWVLVGLLVPCLAFSSPPVTTTRCPGRLVGVSSELNFGAVRINPGWVGSFQIFRFSVFSFIWSIACARARTYVRSTYVVRT